MWTTARSATCTRPSTTPRKIVRCRTGHRTTGCIRCPPPTSSPPCMKKVVIYGIPNCDTMKKARSWLQAHDVPHEFHDYKKAGIGQAKLAGWAKAVGWEVLLNRNGTTYRKLPDKAKAGLDEARALQLMTEQPSLIKRPVLEHGKS